MLRLLKLTVLLALFYPATYSRAADRVIAVSNSYYGIGALFYPQQGLYSADCQYHLVMLDDYTYIEYEHGWKNRKIATRWELPTPYCNARDVYGLDLDPMKGNLFGFLGPLSDGYYCYDRLVDEGPDVNGVIMYLQTDGNLCAYDHAGSAVWCTMKYWGEQGQSDCRPYDDHPLANSYTYYAWGVDYAGNDVSAFTARGYQDCGKFCAEDYAIGKCDHWTYVGDTWIGVCWLKVGNPNMVLHAGDRQYVSGRILKG